MPDINKIGDKTVENIETHTEQKADDIKPPRETTIAKLTAKNQAKNEKKGEDTPPAQTGAGEKNTSTRSERNEDALAPNSALGLQGTSLSDAESQAPALADGMLPFLEGWKANLVDWDHDWINTARDELQMPLKAGISGTTYRFMHMAQLFNGDLEGTRLAALGHLIPISAHSFQRSCLQRLRLCRTCVVNTNPYHLGMTAV